MTKNCTTAKKGVFLATVKANKQIGRRFYIPLSEEVFFF